MTDTPARRTCIVAEDNPAMREFIRRVLAAEGWLVFGAQGGREALELVTAHRADLLVTDLAMPDGDGIETIRALRTHVPDVKILALSGAFGPHMLRVAELLGAGASLEKPFTAEMLRASVRALTEPPR